MLNHKLFNFNNAFYIKLKSDTKKYNITLFEALKFYDELNQYVKYFMDYYYLLSNEIKELSLIDFFDRLVFILSLEEYYMKQSNGQIHFQRINNFKEFFEDVPINNPKEQVLEIINNLTLENTTSKKDADDKVQFMTIHQAKGLEYPIVIMQGLEEGILP